MQRWWDVKCYCKTNTLVVDRVHFIVLRKYNYLFLINLKIDFGKEWIKVKNNFVVVLVTKVSFTQHLPSTNKQRTQGITAETIEIKYSVKSVIKGQRSRLGKTSWGRMRQGRIRQGRFGQGRIGRGWTGTAWFIRRTFRTVKAARRNSNESVNLVYRRVRRARCGSIRWKLMISLW